MSQSFVCLFNMVWVGISQTGLTPLHFMGLSQVRNLFGNGPVSYCFVYIIWIWDVFVRWVVVFVQNLSYFIYKGPIRACRRVRVYSPHWSRLMEISLSSMLMLTAEIAWQQMHSSAVSIVEHDPHSHLRWLEQLLNKLMQITSSGMSWKKALQALKRLDLIFGVLMPLSKIFQLYHGDQF